MLRGIGNTVRGVRGISVANHCHNNHYYMQFSKQYVIANLQYTCTSLRDIIRPHRTHACIDAAHGGRTSAPGQTPSG